MLDGFKSPKGRNRDRSPARMRISQRRDVGKSWSMKASQRNYNSDSGIGVLDPVPPKVFCQHSRGTCCCQPAPLSTARARTSHQRLHSQRTSVAWDSGMAFVRILGNLAWSIEAEDRADLRIASISQLHRPGKRRLLRKASTRSRSDGGKVRNDLGHRRYMRRAGHVCI